MEQGIILLLKGSLYRGEIEASASFYLCILSAWWEVA